MNRQSSARDASAKHLAEAVGRGMYERDAAARSLGISLLDVGPGRARVAMTVRPDMVNGHDICHGGFIFTLADTAFAYSCNSHNRNAVAQHCTISFLQPAHKGDLLTAEGEEEVLRGRNGIYDIRVTNQRSELVALFRGNSRVIKGEVVADPALAERPSVMEPS